MLINDLEGRGVEDWLSRGVQYTYGVIVRGALRRERQGVADHRESCSAQMSEGELVQFILRLFASSHKHSLRKVLYMYVLKHNASVPCPLRVGRASVARVGASALAHAVG